MKKPEVNEPLLNRWIESIRSTGCCDEVQEVLFNCLPLISEYCIKDDYIKEYKSLQESLEFYNFIIPNVEVVLTRFVIGTVMSAPIERFPKKS